MKRLCLESLKHSKLVPFTVVWGLLVICLGVGVAQGQGLLSDKMEIEDVQADTSYFLGSWVQGHTVKVVHKDTLIPRAYWDFSELSGEWRWNAKGQFLSRIKELDTITIRFRYRPLDLQRVYSRRQQIERDTARYEEQQADTASGKVLQTRITEESLFGDVQLQKSGSLTRGVIVGSNKDLSLESGLRLDMEGQLTDELKLTASLTDESTPIQPDGSTQNLREFDKVFIRLESDATRMEMGDVDVSFDNSNFATVNRRLIGLEGEVNTGEENYKGAFSVARGRFRSMTISGRDGVQGPYRLTGAEGEEFVTVLAGTEKVYINGQRVNRGAENDYVIDYGIGEITFTNEQIITEETRIVVDFQYINRDFTRSLLASEAQTERLLDGKLTIGASVIREADNDDVRGQLALTPEDVDVLREAGDDLDKAVVSGVDSVGVQEDGNDILYARVDTVYDGQVRSIYQHTGDKERNVYRIRFSNVGEGNGSYRRVGRATNGILYEWAGPGNGSYEPFEQLPAPEKQQMATIRSRYRFSSHLNMEAEWAVSDFDKNRFSPLDDGNNIGHAYYTDLNLKEVETEAGTFNAGIKHRYNDTRFRYFDRAREVEYDRKWNLTGDISGMERVTEVSADLELDNNSSITTGASMLDRERFSGRRVESQLNMNPDNLPKANYRISYLTSEDLNLREDGTWLKQRGRLSYDWEVGAGTLSPSLNGEYEKRKIETIGADTLVNRSLQFYELGPSLEYSIGEFLISSGVNYRLDKKPLNGELQKEAEGVTHRYRLNYTGEDVQTKNELAFRSKSYTQSFATEAGNRDSKGVFLKSDNEAEFWSDIVKTELLYEANTRRKAILQETFRKVGPEIGQYIWEDLNGDGIQQIDEFFPEQTPNEGVFIKQLIPSDNLIPIIDLQARLQTTIEPFNRTGNGRSSNEKSWGLWDDLRLQSLFEINESNRTQNLAQVYRLNSDYLLNDSTTIQGQWYWRQQLEWKPRDPIYGLTAEVSRNRSLNRSSVGLQKADRWHYQLAGRYRIKKRYNLRAEFIHDTDRNTNDELSSRNYDISEWIVRPILEATVSRSYQQNLSVSYHWKTDNVPTPQNQVDMISMETDARWFIMQELQTSARLSWNYTRMQGESSSLGRFELTNGSGEGSNWNWSLRANYRINQLIRASLNYDGRTVTDGSNIHTLRMVVSASF